MGAVPLVGSPPMVPLPPVQQLGFGTSRWWLQETLHQACAQAKGGIIFFLPRKSLLLMPWTAPPPALACHRTGRSCYGRMIRRSQGTQMEAVKVIGFDIAKSVFQVHGINAEGKVIVRRQLKRRHVLPFLQKLPPCLVGIKARASSH